MRTLQTFSRGYRRILRVAVLAAAAVGLLVTASAVVPATSWAEEDEPPPDDEPKRDGPLAEAPLDNGFYFGVGGVPLMMETGRLSAKIADSEELPLITPGLDLELHFFGRETGLFGFSSTLWASEADGEAMDVEVDGWDLQMDFGTPAANFGTVSSMILVGLGYAENFIRFDGDFRAVDLGDPDLPSGNGEAKLRQQAFVYDVALRTDIRDPFGKRRKGGGLWLTGFSVGYKGQAAGRWHRAARRISNVPYVAERAFFASLHLGLGAGGRNVTDVPVY
ncbi:MAG: hypothetical protein H6684_15590 [Deltaproteobacteria bacterium]|nr:hypothetical protein [Deltaproteobacteria bacterium]